jgi:hypothetical protein
MATLRFKNDFKVQTLLKVIREVSSTPFAIMFMKPKLKKHCN